MTITYYRHCFVALLNPKSFYATHVSSQKVKSLPFTSHFQQHLYDLSPSNPLAFTTSSPHPPGASQIYTATKGPPVTSTRMSRSRRRVSGASSAPSSLGRISSLEREEIVEKKKECLGIYTYRDMHKTVTARSRYRCGFAVRACCGDSAKWKSFDVGALRGFAWGSDIVLC